MLVGGKTGPALYCCLLMQLYYFSIIINNRVESNAGSSFTFHCFFVYWTMQHYFFRGSHRENFAAIQFGKVCPGGVYCGEELHWILIFFELLAPFIISLLLLPIIVRQRATQMDAYSRGKKGLDSPAISKEDTPSRPAKEETPSRPVKELSPGHLSEKSPMRNIERSTRNEPTQLHVNFSGNMSRGISYFQVYAILLVITSSIHVYQTRKQPVFDRTGPKFIFDVFFALTWNNFVLFWQ